MTAFDGPHQDQPLVSAGAPLEVAEAAVVLVHGRGASAESILRLADEFHQHGVAYFAPQAAGHTWYPNSFLAPVESNEPGRTSGLAAVANAVETAIDSGVERDRIAILGFSQGACLASEFVARNPTRYGGLVALSGGLIGETVDAADYLESADGDLEGTPAFFGCSDVDPHIPVERVHESAAVLDDLGADVTTRIYEGMAHTINDDEIAFVTDLVAGLTDEGDSP
ncbi:alpha/beta hydrolase [Natronobiforma cellulositropha]|uniref:alpha/beta hydrolase n=1 Tax=Natronobiforma cellulositropha TaxID=1679076 RepID=UPI0021D589BE|nr:alpha/beta hydrolase [Natronobiforma cellulositropha]